MNTIEIGDFVDIFFMTTDAEFYVEVLRVPWSTGDSWVVKRRDGTIVNVHIFSKMVKKEPNHE